MPERRKSPVVPLTIAVVAVVVLVVTVLGSRGPGGPDGGAGPAASASAPEAGRGSAGGRDAERSQNRAPDATWEQLVRREPHDPMARGDVDAPVVMIAYSEFQCPFCGKFARDTEPTLVDKYVEDGTLRIEWRDFPYLGPESRTAAEAGRAAAAQGRFWDFHDQMYAHQLPPNSGRLDEQYVLDVADGLGLDLDRFRADLTSDTTRAAIARDFGEGQSIGVTGTPTFVINGIPVVGAQPVGVFEATIEQAARDAGA